MGLSYYDIGKPTHTTHISITMKLIGLPLLGFAALASAQNMDLHKKKDDFVPTLKSKYFETCIDVTPKRLTRPATWIGVKRDTGLSEAAQQAIIDNIHTENNLIFAQKSQKEILDLEQLAEKFEDKKMVEKFAKIKVLQKGGN